MKQQEFKEWLLNEKRRHLGKLGYYTETAVNSRINSLIRLEDYFKVNLDDIVKSRDGSINFLVSIRNAHIEDLAHTPLSNAFRHYYKFATGDYIDKIF